jgi:hypothetical protein
LKSVKGKENKGDREGRWAGKERKSERKEEAEETRDGRARMGVAFLALISNGEAWYWGWAEGQG